MEQALEILVGWAESYGPMLLGSLAIFIIGRILIGIIAGWITKGMNRTGADKTLIKFVVSLVRIGLLALVIVASISNLGVEMTSFVAIIGAAGLAVGFALQNSLSNFASGVMLIIFHPFKAGDFVEAGGSAGTVENITIFNTIMRAGDNKKIIIPNSNITGNNITNFSANNTRRIDFVFGIGYNDDLKKAKSILEQMMSEVKRVLKDPAPVVAVSELADSSVNFIVRPWVKSADYWNVYWDTMEKVKLTFDNQGISIPYPQQDVHMHQVTTV